MLLSEILGKRVVVINTADELGCIIGAYVHKNTFARTHLILENNRHIKLEDVFSYGEIITVLEHGEESIPLDDYYKITSLQGTPRGSSLKNAQFQSILCRVIKICKESK